LDKGNKLKESHGSVPRKKKHWVYRKKKEKEEENEM
jgi:hypothetical protein